MKKMALDILRKSLGNPVADFRDGQWESIEGLLKRERMLVVQRTGWSKISFPNWVLILKRSVGLWYGKA
ncbi:MAG: hypothetical protein PF503_22010 [Desulfobacula sp.]|jgi:superfamily II DNA helicase RecQ|nr:hypothetical protein [Desulfobacula sp.]